MTDFNHNSSKIRILLVDDQNLVRQAIQIYLEREQDLEIVGQAENGTIALEKVEMLDPDVIIIDLEMPGIDGFTVIESIRKYHKTKAKVLVLSSYDDRKYINRAIGVGAKGYVLKGTPPQELTNVIRNIHQGYFQLGPGLLEKLLVNSENSASNRERQIEDKINRLLKQFKTETTALYDRTIETKLGKISEDFNDRLDYRIRDLKFKNTEIGFEFKKVKNQIIILVIGQICLFILLIITAVFF
jgi:DNA-binding NarL/FixJ family response regulator